MGVFASARNEVKMTQITPEAMAKAERVLARVRQDWLQRPGVTAVDLGFEWTNGAMTPVLALRVHVSRKKALTELTPQEVFPEMVEGIPVDVIEATYGLQQSGLETQLEAAIEGRGGRFNDIPLGVSVGCQYSTAGTLGAKVIDRESGAEMILSNWHVLVGRPEGQADLAIWQPGQLDGGALAGNVIAGLSRWVIGPYDAAVARLAGNRPVQSKTVEGKAIDRLGSPALGMMVWKSGRTTGYTEGFIDGVKMTTQLSYAGVGQKVLQQVFRVVPRPGRGEVEISAGGDSGSIWVDESSGKAVGLHFAGEVGNVSEYALAHELAWVLDALNVRLPSQDAPVEPIPSPTPAPTPAPAPAPPPSLFQSLLSFLARLFGRR
jgi:hypothetical protein